MKHQVIMLKTEKGRDDGPGAVVRTYEANGVYEIGRDLRRAFLEMGAAQDYPPAGLASKPSAATAEDEDDIAPLPGENRETKIEGPEEPRRRGRPPGSRK